MYMFLLYTEGLFGFDLMRNAKPVTRFRTVTKSPRLTGLARAHPLHHPFAAGRNTDAVGPLEKRKPQDVVWCSCMRPNFSIARSLTHLHPNVVEAQ